MFEINLACRDTCSAYAYEQDAFLVPAGHIVLVASRVYVNTHKIRKNCCKTAVGDVIVAWMNKCNELLTNVNIL